MSFDAQPILKGERVELRPLRVEDFEALRDAAADPLIWEQHPENRHEDACFEAFFRDAIASGDALVVIDADSRRVIGSSRYHGYDERARDVEIGWTFLARSHWGSACNGEMKRLMLQHAFQYVDSVAFIVDIENHRSRRAVEKIGGVHDGSRTDAHGRVNFIYRITAQTGVGP